MAVNWKPEGYHTVTPYLIGRGTAELIEFLKQSFGAQERERHMRPDGTIMHAEVRIGDSIVMMGEASDEFKAMPTSIHLYLEDVDAAHERAVSAGANRSGSRPTSSTATAAPASKTQRATSGGSPRTSKTSRPKRCSAVKRQWLRRNQAPTDGFYGQLTTGWGARRPSPACR